MQLETIKENTLFILFSANGQVFIAVDAGYTNHMLVNWKSTRKGA